MFGAGAVNIRLGLIVSDLISGARAGQAAISRLAGEINGNLSASYARADREQRVYDRGLGRLGNNMQDFGRKASVVTGILAGIGAAAFGSYADIDGMQRALKVVTGSTQEANVQFTQFRQLARLPGLGLEEVVQAGLQLETLGFKAKEAQKDIYEVGNAIALGGKGKLEFGSVITQFTQMAGKAKVLGDDLKPIVNASPVIAKAINNIFGTVDSEQVSSKLQAAGKGPRDFINLLVAELSKLERVEGGPKNALENLGDGLKNAGFEFAKAADQSLDLTGKLDAAGTTIETLATGFGKLPASAKAGVLGLTGIAAATGPVILGIGTVINLLPTLKLGFAALSGPVGLAAAAVVGGAVLIAANWNTVKQVLSDSGVWTALVGAVQSGIDLVKGTFQSGVTLLTVLWDRFGGFIVGAGKTAFEGIVAVFRLGGGVLQGVFRTLTGILTLDWRTAVSGIGDIAKSLWNFVIDGFKLMAAFVGRTVAGMFQFFGGESIADRITTGIDRALLKLDGLKGKITETQLAAAKGIPAAATTSPLAGVIEGPKINLNGAGKSDLQIAKDRLKELQALIFQGTKKGQDVSAYVSEARALKEQIDATTKSYKGQKAATDAIGSSLSVNERLLKRYELQVKNAGSAATDYQRNMVSLLKQEVEHDKERLKYAEAFGKLKAIEPKFATDEKVKEGAIQTADNVAKAMQDRLNQKRLVLNFGTAGFYQDQISQIEQKISNASLGRALVDDEDFDTLTSYTSAVQRAQEAVESARDKVQDMQLAKLPVTLDLGIVQILDASSTKMNAAIRNLKAGIEASLKETAQSALVGMGEVIGGLAAGTAGVESIPNLLLNTLGGLMTQLGKIAIQTAIGITAIQTALKSLNPAIALAAGVGLIALGTVVRSQVSNLGSRSGATPFANGGIVYGPTLGLMGEYSGARNNPEVIAPLNKLKSILGSQGPQVMIPDIVLDGQMIRIVLMRANESYAQFS